MQMVTMVRSTGIKAGEQVQVLKDFFKLKLSNQHISTRYALAKFNKRILM